MDFFKRFRDTRITKSDVAILIGKIALTTFMCVLTGLIFGLLIVIALDRVVIEIIKWKFGV
jgi:hypothetical protein